MGCIEIAVAESRSSKPDSINRNMGCIEIAYNECVLYP